MAPKTRFAFSPKGGAGEALRELSVGRGEAAVVETALRLLAAQTRAHGEAGWRQHGRVLAAGRPVTGEVCSEQRLHQLQQKIAPVSIHLTSLASPHLLHAIYRVHGVASDAGRE